MRVAGAACRGREVETNEQYTPASAVRVMRIYSQTSLAGHDERERKRRGKEGGRGG